MTTNDILLKMLLDRWNGAMKNCDDTLNKIDNAGLMQEIAPGKNRGIYLLGHLVAVHDHMLVLMDMGDRKYPDYAKLFIDSPDKTIEPLPEIAEIRRIWNEQKADFQTHFSKMSIENWLEKHTAVSAEDFAKEPYRNKLNILLTRTTHLTYHTGQLALLVKNNS